jgi:PhzF family phenazine biosynthesis protein
VSDLLLVDAFTRQPGTGNPAAVVPDASGLTEERMRRIAAEFPTTAFVSDRRLRWLTSTGAELSFCGHGTVAAVHALRETGRLREPRLVFETRAGALPVAAEGGLIWLSPALRGWAPAGEPLEPVLEALGLGPGDLGGWAPVARTSEGDLLLPVAGLHVLKGLAVDAGRLGAVARERGLRGVALTSRETVEPGSATHSRFFAPHLGIPEDPTTGSLHAALPVWLWDAGALRESGAVVRVRAEQGDFLGRPGRLALELSLDGGRPARVRVGGEAVTVLSGRLGAA